MSEQTLDRMIENAATSVEMEGYIIDEQVKDLCRHLMSGDITMAEYITEIRRRAGAL